MSVSVFSINRYIKVRWGTMRLKGNVFMTDVKLHFIRNYTF